MIELYDNEQAYCRKLGHHLHFKYCRTERDGKPCSKVKDCWFAKFEVETYMNKYYANQTIPDAIDTRFNKTSMLLNIVQEVQKRRLQELSNSTD